MVLVTMFRMDRTMYFFIITLLISWRHHVVHGMDPGTSCLIKDNKVDCSRRNYTCIPPHFKTVSIRNIRHITEIDFSHNYIKYIRGNYFRGFAQLEVLKLSGNQLIGNRSSFGNIFRNLPNLRELHLDHNRFRRIPTRLFTNLRNLSKLYLDGNLIERVRRHAFDGLSSLTELRLRNNRIRKISSEAFTGLGDSLQRLNLKSNRLRSIPRAIKSLTKLEWVDLSDNDIHVIRNNSFAGLAYLKEFFVFIPPSLTAKKKRRSVWIKDNAFRLMPSLEKLNLDSPYAVLHKFPNLFGTDNIRELRLGGIYNLTIPSSFCRKKEHLEIIRIRNSTVFEFPILNQCSNLRNIDLIQNKISRISKYAFSGLQHISIIDILQKHNKVDSIDKDAFSNLPSLKELDLSHYSLNIFPNFSGTRNLQKLKLHLCNIRNLPTNLCAYLPNLENLDLSENGLERIPSLTQCTKLKVLDLFRNQITTIDNQLNNLTKLEILTLSDNHLSKIRNSTFSGCPHITSLYLDWNMIHQIEEDAFKDILNLEILNVSYNTRLQKLPSRGIKSLVVIDAVKNTDLLSFPQQDALPYARQLRLTYPYHCCFFMQRVQKLRQILRVEKLQANSTWVIERHGDYTQILSQYNATSVREIEPRNMEPIIRLLNNKTNTRIKFYPEIKNNKRTLMIYKGLKGRSISDESFCVPESNEFFPCETLMGQQWLRFTAWLVIFLAVVGNIFVLIVLTVNYKKLDVPRLLIMNLAFADLCLGVYLAFLAFVDLYTLGDFRMFGLQWQFSPSCKGAGFLAVFSSELSVYTLSAITIERFTTIKNSMHVEKRITKKQAYIIMLTGWLFSVLVAALPLYSKGSIKFSDYSKYSVCLPFDIETATSKGYVIFVLAFNLLAFILILACYIKIYLFISGSHAWNSGDARIARRMAILVFTDFLCWFPIALIAMSAVFKNSLIRDLSISKVLTIFVFPLNACSNPFLYAILTKQFRKDIMLFVRHLKGKSIQREIRKSLIKSQFKNSLTYSTSVRRGSSFSFLFGRRCSSKTDDIKLHARIIPVQEPFPIPVSKESEEEKHVEIGEEDEPIGKNDDVYCYDDVIMDRSNNNIESRDDFDSSCNDVTDDLSDDVSDDVELNEETEESSSMKSDDSDETDKSENEGDKLNTEVTNVLYECLDTTSSTSGEDGILGSPSAENEDLTENEIIGTESTECQSVGSPTNGNVTRC